ncbi:hypothetical protein [Paracoccus sp. SSJ]|uniref:hypothetical protein n=1 Tax=Paracoccus sp. SSJ TaxID=3050636 RepID=UPI00254D8B4C|nr:hypothetical protein [Paracoccus sp. SSJ]MDK8874718.1 hypothetical protein [Paracoccus sp. SSJ]
MTGDITEAEFIERFVNHMVLIGGTEFADGSSIEAYAREAAPTYWAEVDQREDGPEACAQADISCWEYEA